MYLMEMEHEHTGISNHINVHRLSRRNVLRRFITLTDDTVAFVNEKDQMPQPHDERLSRDLMFLTDISGQRNPLNKDPARKGLYRFGHGT